MNLKIGMISGEPSGDLIANQLIISLRNKESNSVYMGIGGPKMDSCGFQSLYSMDHLTTFGYVDSIKRLPKLLYIYTRMKRYWTKNPPSFFIGIDAPDFNLPLEKQLKKVGIPTFHFVSPSIWAWRYNRIFQIRESVSHIFVLFPFEKEIYLKEGIPVTYIGHPLAKLIPMEPDQYSSRKFLGLEKTERILAILPGSRPSEIRLLAPIFLKTAQLLSKTDPDLQFIVPMVNRSCYSLFQKILKKNPVRKLKVLFQEDSPENQSDGVVQPISWTAMRASTSVLTASGTATLEAALHKKPMVISYLLSPMMLRLMSWKSKQKAPYIPWVGLPNILSNDFIVPEFIQDNATPENLAEATWSMLISNEKRSEIERRFKKIHQELLLDTPNIIIDQMLEYIEK